MTNNARTRKGIEIDVDAIFHNGTLNKVIFSKESFLIAEIGGVVCKGTISKPIKGCFYDLEGKFSYSQKQSEHQFEFTKATPRLEERSGIVEYLLREAPGVGPKTALAIATQFGKETLQILRDNPERVCEVRGISKKDSETLQSWAKQDASNASIKERLYEIGLLPAQVAKVVAHYGNYAEQKIRKDCFRLTEIHGFGFVTVAKIADLVGVPADDPGRVRAALLYVCDFQSQQEGHTCCTVRELARLANEYLGIGGEKILEEIRWLLANRHLISFGTRLMEVAEERGISYP